MREAGIVSNRGDVTVTYLDVSESFVVTDGSQFDVASIPLSISMR